MPWWLRGAVLLVGSVAAGTYGCGQRMPILVPGPADGRQPDASAADLPRDSRDTGAQDQSVQDQSVQDQSVQDQSVQDQSVQDQSVQDQAAEDRATSPDTGPADGGTSCPADVAALNVCGCGCCGGTPQGHACYYPARGESISTIPNPMPTPASCAAAGCSFGLRYLCCADPGAPALPTASYCSRDLATNLERYVVIKTEGAVCTQLQLDGYTSSSSFPISTSPGFSVAIGSMGPCDGSAPTRYAIGGLGSVDFKRAAGSSTFDVHVTLFFDGASGTASAVRLDVDGLTLSPGCPNAILP